MITAIPVVASSGSGDINDASLDGHSTPDCKGCKSQPERDTGEFNITSIIKYSHTQHTE